jgi:hypothetical protein
MSARSLRLSDFQYISILFIRNNTFSSIVFLTISVYYIASLAFTILSNILPEFSYDYSFVEIILRLKSFRNVIFESRIIRNTLINHTNLKWLEFLFFYKSKNLNLKWRTMMSMPLFCWRWKML